jgi:hypothetical protein
MWGKREGGDEKNINKRHDRREQKHMHERGEFRDTGAKEGITHLLPHPTIEAP